jgi:hypothetical protein
MKIYPLLSDIFVEKLRGTILIKILDQKIYQYYIDIDKEHDKKINPAILFLVIEI